jgi:replicative DNA helicase
VGKTTVAQQLILRRIGIGPPELLGQPVAVTDNKVLYLPMDRPQQAGRSLRRMVSETDRDQLAERLAVWRGTLPIDIVRDPGSLATFALDRGADTLVIDGVKDLAPKLSDEETGMAIHKSWQLCLEQGIEVLGLHWPRKAQADNSKPKALADVYGSRWITAGCGSVILLWGNAGDPIVRLEHLKQPADQVGPLELLHDNHAGTTTVIDTKDVVEIVKAHIGPPPTARQVAAVMFGKTTPDTNQVEKARRRLNAAVRDGRLGERPVVTDGQKGTGYVAV